jgi:hypothetical protein
VADSGRKFPIVEPGKYTTRRRTGPRGCGTSNGSVKSAQTGSTSTCGKRAASCSAERSRCSREMSTSTQPAASRSRASSRRVLTLLPLPYSTISAPGPMPSAIAATSRSMIASSVRVG